MPRRRDPTPDSPVETGVPSKTQRKAAMQALQDLGEQLIALPRERRARLPLDDGLRQAIDEYERLGAHEARRRQMQYIGRLMRDVDTAPISEAIAAFTGTSRAESARLHRIEALRERVLADESELTTLLADHPGADIQRLRQLRRNTIAERARGAPPRSFRALFQLLKEILEGSQT